MKVRMKGSQGWLGSNCVCVESSFQRRYEILRSCLVGQMCRISVVDQSKGAVDEKAGSSLNAL